MPMPSLVKTAVDRRIVRDESSITTALALQCQHVQRLHDLDAVVVTDDIASSWVGSGDRSLCRLLSAATPDLVAGTNAQGDYRLKTLQALKQDLRPQDLTTYTIKVPHLQRYIHIAGIGYNSDRARGIIRTADGTRRIMRFNPPSVQRLHHDFTVDPNGTLARLTYVGFNRYVYSPLVVGTAPVRRLGWYDDGTYKSALDAILEPAISTLVRAGFKVSGLWRRTWLAGKEWENLDGSYTRELYATLREARSGMKLGRLRVAFSHRHDTFHMVACPEVEILWNV